MATNVMGLVQTKLDTFTSARIYAKCNADVALFTAKALEPLQTAPILASNSSTFGPRDKKSERRTSVTDVIS